MRTPIAAAICCTVVAAHADPRQDARLHAEQLERAATASREPAAFVRCGNAFLDVVRLAPTASDADESAYNAGVCFEEGRALDPALAAFHTVITSFPRSRLAPKAIARTAHLAQQVGNLDEAATWLETYAAKFAGERDAFEASSEAVYFRRVLGDDAKLIDDVKLFVRTFKGSDDDKATATFSLTPIYERRSPDDAIKHLRAYLATYGSRGGPLRLVVAYTELGSLLLRQACAVKPIDGLCMKPGPARAVVKRDAKLVKEAAVALDQAKRVFVQVSSPDAPTVHAFAMARLAAADIELEAHATTAADSYRAVIALGDPTAVIAASARLAALADTPARALELFKACVAKASELAVADEWSRLCKRGRAQLDPDHFTTRDELRPDPATIWPEPTADAVKPQDGDPESLRSAVAEFEAREHSGWNATTCRQSADRFAALARTSGMAPYMVGLSYQRCGMVDQARDAYQRAGDPVSLANVGALEWQVGHGAAAETAWRELISHHDDTGRAHLGLAIALFTRAHGDRALEREGEAELAIARMAALAPAYVVAAIRDLSRPALADYDLHQAEDEHDDSTALDVALGVRAIERGGWSYAVDRLAAAVALPRVPDEARLDLAIALLAVDRFDDAIAQLAPIGQPSYDVLVARGIALRGQGKVAEADADYARAIALDPARALAFYDRGILDKEYVARTADVATRKAALRRAADSLHRAAAADPKLDAAALAAECETALR